MNLKLKSSVLAACAALTLAGGVVYATESGNQNEAKASHMHRHSQRGSALMSTLKQLNLTPEQQQSVRSVFQNNADQHKTLSEQRRANRQALASTLPDDPKYPGLIEERKRLATESIQQRSDTETQIYALLTPEQKAQVPQLLAERKARWEQHRQQRQSTSDAS
jgi:protein CpxP